MCGISLLINQQDNTIDSTLLHNMNEQIIHRGPDNHGVFMEKNIGLGHRRLAIIDLSSAGKQPMSYWENTITYNGEIYNYIELRQELITKGYTFSTETDTEVILASYDYWGQECVHKFNGMWAFCLYDRKRQLIFCSRDRFGIKPFVYTTINNMFVAGSESKQFLNIPFFKPQLNHSTVFDFLFYKTLNTNEDTFLKGVKHLQAGHNLIYHLDKHVFKIQKWYDLHQVKTLDAKNISFEEAGKEFERLLSNSIKLRLRSDVKLGSCLSGGMDSSSIVCLAKQGLDKIYTVSSCYHDKNYDEQFFIDIVNQEVQGIPLKVFPNLTDLLSKNLLTKIVYHQDQPISSASHFSEYHVFSTAAQNNLTVMLDGQGADEYLAGYGEFFMFYWKFLLKSGQLHKLCSEVKARSNKQKQSISSNLNRFLNFLFLQNLKKRIKQKLGKIKKIPVWIDKELYQKNIKNDNVNPRNIKKWKDIHSISKHELLQYSLPYQLHSEDRNSMLHSIESRLPFLDVHLVEFCLSLPDEYKIKTGTTKAILREGMKNILPPQILHRHDKMGFVAPEQKWVNEDTPIIREELKDAVLHLKGIITKDIINIFDKTINQNSNYNNLFFRIISLNHWVKSFNVTVK